MTMEDRVLRRILESGSFITPEQEELYQNQLRKSMPWYATAPVISQGFRALNWVDEKVTKPFASIVTAPWSTFGANQDPLQRRAGETWFEYQRRKYDEWESPRFVKGFVESLNPIYFIPVGGTLARVAGGLAKFGVPGAKALGTIGRAVTFAEEIPGKAVGKAWTGLGLPKPVLRKAVPKTLTDAPTGADVLARSIRPDKYRRIAESLSKVPVVGKAVKLIGGEAALLGKQAKETSSRMYQRVAGEAVLVHKAITKDWGPGVKALKMAELYDIAPDAVKLLGTDATKKGREKAMSAIAKNVELKPGYEGASLAVGDVLSTMPGKASPYALTAAQEQYVLKIQRLGDWGEELLTKAGVYNPTDAGRLRKALEELAGKKYVARFVRGVEGEVGLAAKGGARGKMGKQPFEFSRTAEEMITNIKKHVIYEADPNVIASAYIDEIINRVGAQRFGEHLIPYARTAAIPEEFKLAVRKAERKLQGISNATDNIKRAASGLSLKGAQIGAIRRNLPELATEVERVLAINPSDVPKIIKDMSADIWAQAKVTPEQFQKALIEAKVKEARAVTKGVTERMPKGATPEAPKPPVAKAGAPGTSKLVEDTAAFIDRQRKTRGGPRSVVESEFDKLDVAGFDTESAAKTFWEGYYKEYTKLGVPKAERDRLWNEFIASVKEIKPKVAEAPKPVAEAGAPIMGEFKEAFPIGIPTKNFTAADIKATLKQLNVDAKTSKKMLEQIYKNQYKYLSEERKLALNELITRAQPSISEAKAASVAAKAEKAAAKERAKASWKTLGDGTVVKEHMVFGNRELQGKIFPGDITAELDRLFADQGHALLAGAEKISAIGRMTKASLDFSAPFIQGLPLLAMNPIKWGEVTLKHYRAFLSPNVVNKFYRENAEELATMLYYGAHLGATEFYGPGLANLKNLTTKIPGKIGEMSEGAITQTFGRFGQSFGYFGDMARLEIWRALKGKAAASGELGQLSRLVNRMTGVSSPEVLGVGLGQRQIEGGLFFFAPGYLRATMSFVADIGKGGMTGAVARNNLGKLMAGGAAFYTGVCFALGQEPNFDPRSAKFMTVKIGNQHFGIGGTVYSLSRLAGNIATQAANKPLDLVKLWDRDNAFNRFIFSKASMLTGNLRQLQENKNFLGEELESFADYARWLAEAVAPIAVADVAFRGQFHPLNMPAAMAGMRGFPKSPAELRDERKKELITSMPEGDVLKEQKDLWREGKLQWDELTSLQKANFEQDELLTKYTAEAEERARKTGGVEQKVWTKWGDEKGIYKEKLLGSQSDLQEGFLDGSLSLTDFRLLSNDASSSYGDKMGSLAERGEYADIYKYFDEPTDDHLVDFENALNDYERLMYSTEGLEDRFGRYDYEEAARREQAIKSKWGGDAWEYIQETLEERQSNEPWLKQELREVREYLKRYWDTRDKVLGRFPTAARIDKLLENPSLDPEKRRILQKHPEYARFSRMLEDVHKGMRMTDPMLDALLYLWYNENGNRTWATPGALNVIKRLTREYQTQISKSLSWSAES